MAACLILLVVAALPAESANPSSAKWHAEVVGQGLDPTEPVYIFEATPEMAEWASEHVEERRSRRALQRLETLQRALFDRSDFNFEYEEALTLSAPQAFEQRRGNCLAFTSLFVALGRSIGIPVVLVSVETAPDIFRADGLVIVNRHVVAGYRDFNKLHLFDFYATSDAPYVQQRVISDVTASAMYHANVGGSALRSDDLDDARRHLELATRLAPDWAPAWVNLGVVLHRQGLDDEAMHAYARALDAEPTSPSALTNMAAIYRRSGELDAERAALAAATKRTRNPFTLIAMADLEMNRGELAKARARLRRAKWWYPREPEVYDALARIADRAGEADRVKRYRDRAAELRGAVAE